VCLAVTGRVVSVDGDDAIVTLAGRDRRVSRVLEPETSAGDWVSVGMGWIFRRLTTAEAEELLDLEALAATPGDGPR
jgi:hydrogenase maturation factor